MCTCRFRERGCISKLIEQAIGVVWAALPGIASAVVIALAGFAYRQMRSFREEHRRLVEHLNKCEASEGADEELRAMQEAQNAALRELLGRALDDEHARLVEQGYASPPEKLRFERLYLAYHGLGGNGTRTAHYEDVMQMKSYPGKQTN